jgi:hypothetical protein
MSVGYLLLVIIHSMLELQHELNAPRCGSTVRCIVVGSGSVTEGRLWAPTETKPQN